MANITLDVTSITVLAENSMIRVFDDLYHHLYALSQSDGRWTLII